MSVEDFVLPVKRILLVSISLISLLVVGLMEPIPQWSSYHRFADQRTLFGISNFLNVSSSLVYLVIAGWCLIELIGRRKRFGLAGTELAPVLFFCGMLLTGVGSAIYHLNPTNQGLFWDRLPMTISFMSFSAYVVTVCIDEKWGQRLLFPLLGIGVLSVLYWYYTESLGQGDLRFYGLVQFLPMLLIPLVLLMYRDTSPAQRYLWWVVIIYAVAKIAEITDLLLMDTLGVSGHTLKHIISAITAVALLKAVYSRGEKI